SRTPWGLADVPADVVPALLAQLAAPDGEPRVTAARALGKIGPPAAAAVTALTLALADDSNSSSTVRHAAVTALANIDPDRPKPPEVRAAIPALVRRLNGPDELRRAAESALGLIDPKWPASAEARPLIPEMVDAAARGSAYAESLLARMDKNWPNSPE